MGLLALSTTSTYSFSTLSNGAPFSNGITFTCINNTGNNIKLTKIHLGCGTAIGTYYYNSGGSITSHNFAGSSITATATISATGVSAHSANFTISTQVYSGGGSSSQTSWPRYADLADGGSSGNGFPISSFSSSDIIVSNGATITFTIARGEEQTSNKGFVWDRSGGTNRITPSIEYEVAHSYIAPTASISVTSTNVTSLTCSYNISSTGSADGIAASIISRKIVLTDGVNSITYNPTSNSGSYTFTGLVRTNTYILTFTVVNNNPQNNTTSPQTSGTTTNIALPTITNVNYSYTPADDAPTIESTFSGSWNGTRGSNIGTFNYVVTPYYSNTSSTSSGTAIFTESTLFNDVSKDSFSLVQTSTSNVIQLIVGSATKTFSYTFTEDTYLYFTVKGRITYTDYWGNNHIYDSNVVISNIIGPLEDQASIYVLVNNVWKRGKVFVKVGDDWKKAKKVFSKVNGQWIRQKNN